MVSAVDVYVCGWCVVATASKAYAQLPNDAVSQQIPEPKGLVASEITIRGSPSNSDRFQRLILVDELACKFVEPSADQCGSDRGPEAPGSPEDRDGSR